MAQIEYYMTPHGTCDLLAATACLCSNGNRLATAPSFLGSYILTTQEDVQAVLDAFYGCRYEHLDTGNDYPGFRRGA
jgi:hypothetical protein